MSTIAKKYGTARTVLTMLAFIGWLIFLIGLAAAAFGMIIGGTAPGAFMGGPAGMPTGNSTGGAIVGMLPGLFLALIGLFTVASQQVGRALVDGSIAAQESAEILRQQREDDPRMPAVAIPDTTAGRRSPPPLTSPRPA